jgi:hypothetical protein
VRIFPGGLGHLDRRGSWHIPVVSPEIPDRIAPGAKLIEERVALNDIRGIATHTIPDERQLTATVDFIAQELNILAAGGLVVQLDLDGVGACYGYAKLAQVNIIVAAGVFGGREIVRGRNAMPDRLREPAGRFGDTISLGWQPVVLIAVCA